MSMLTLHWEFIKKLVALVLIICNQVHIIHFSHTLTFLPFGVPRAFSVLFFLFLDLLRFTRFTVSLMLVGVCWVAV